MEAVGNQPIHKGKVALAAVSGIASLAVAALGIYGAYWAAGISVSPLERPDAFPMEGCIKWWAVITMGVAGLSSPVGLAWGLSEVDLRDNPDGNGESFREIAAASALGVGGAPLVTALGIAILPLVIVPISYCLYVLHQMP